MTAPALLHEHFLAAAARWPQAIAVSVPPSHARAVRQSVTYAELQRMAEAVAQRVRPLARPDALVAILAERDSPLVYAAQLGVLMAGAAYTCIDPSFPDKQVAAILGDADAVALLADTRSRHRVAAAALQAPLVVELESALGGEPGPVPTPDWLTPASLAYVIYTSGTTGRPKGVMIEHASIANLVAGNLEAFSLGPGDRVAQSSSLAYDSSVEETWLALASGATLVVADAATSRLGPDLVAWLRDERITVFCPPPTLLRSLGCTEPQRALPALRLLYVGGEALPEDVVRLWAPGRALINGYGPTETTVTALRGPVTDAARIPIGVPVPGVRAWVLDEHGNEVPNGARGELCLGGVALARGYRGLPELTAARFPTLPERGRVFRTGDVAHREADGQFLYHGRLDAQVKLRGYRIELEAIEARLSECAGVREAACGVTGDAAHQMLVAFVVPNDPLSAPEASALRDALGRVLPAYMVPGRITVVETLPSTVGGKLDRSRLLALDHPHVPSPGQVPPPSSQSATELAVAAAFQEALGLSGPPSADADFFRVLGGDSLAAALVVSALRRDASTAGVSTRDVYEAPSVEQLAARIDATVVPPEVSPSDRHARTAAPAWQVAAFTAAQAVWLTGELVVLASLLYASILWLAPLLLRRLGPAATVLLAPLLWTTARALLVPPSVALAVAVKWLLIGRYRPGRTPAWSTMHLRLWAVQRVSRLIPWEALAETVFVSAALRALGARVGARVHIHRGVDLSRGGWDLLDLGDDVTLARDAALRLVEMEAGHLVVGAIALGDGVTLDVRAGVGAGCVMGDAASLTAWSSLRAGQHVPAGEQWDGIPAVRRGRTPDPARPQTGRTLTPLAHAWAMAAARLLLWYGIALPFSVAGLVALRFVESTPDGVADLIFGGAWTLRSIGVVLAASATAVPLMLLIEAAAARALGASPQGAISRWSPAYLGVWLKTLLVESAGTWLSGTLFWPVWLRAAGMSIGAKGEISTIVDTVPDLVTLGDACFLADGIYLAGPRHDRGVVMLAPVRLGARTFVGNHAVIACGQTLPADLLLGVCTVSDAASVRAGSAWFGHPPLDLPRHQDGSTDRRLTHDPPAVRYWNRVAWEAARCMLPFAPLLTGLAWAAGVAASARTAHPLTLLLVLVPAWTAGAGAALCVLVLAMKWLLLGRVRPGTHPLWSCWCSRWDFLYVAWAMYARGPLSTLEGTLWLSWYLRAAGMTIGRRVLLGPGFAQVVDPDMLVLEDDATVSAMFQAHTFEDRVLKIDRIRVGRCATLGDATVPLYGADIGAFSDVAAHSVVWKGERLTAGASYEGAPTRLSGWPSPPASAADSL